MTWSAAIRIVAILMLFYSFLLVLQGLKLKFIMLNMDVLFWYLVKSVCVYSILHWFSHFLQGTRKTGPCLSGQVVDPTWLVVIEGLEYWRIW